MSELRKAANKRLEKIHVKILMAVNNKKLDDITRRRTINTLKRRKTDLKAALEEYEQSTQHQIAAQALLISILERERGKR